MDPYSKLLPVALAVLSFGFVTAIIYLALHFERRQRELLHAEVLAAIESGHVLRPDLLLDSELRPRARIGNALKTGIIVLGVGLGLMAACKLGAPERTDWALGLLPAAIGLAYLAYWRIRGRSEWEAAREYERERSTAMTRAVNEDGSGPLASP